MSASALTLLFRPDSAVLNTRIDSWLSRENIASKLGTSVVWLLPVGVNSVILRLFSYPSCSLPVHSHSSVIVFVLLRKDSVLCRKKPKHSKAQSTMPTSRDVRDKP